MASQGFFDKKQYEHGTIEAVLQSLDTAQDVANHIRKEGYVLERDEMKGTLSEFTASISETRMQLSLLQAAMGEKNKQLLRLQEAAFYKANVRRRGDGYYKTIDNRPYGQPYCSYCWEKDQQLFHLHNRILNKDVRVCPHCKNEYQAVRTPFLEAEKLAV